MKKVIALVTAAAMLSMTALTGCGSSSSSSGSSSAASDSSSSETQAAAAESSAKGTYNMKLAHVVAETHPSHVTLIEFKNRVEERTNGDVTVDLIPNGALGGEAQLVEMLELDSLQGTVVGADSATGTIKEFGLIGAPYMFASKESAYASLDGDFGSALAELASTHNIYVAGWGTAGFRNITNSKHEVVKPEDIKGLKIRVMENDLHMKLFQTLGANPSPLAFNELFTALQQGTVDAQENPITVFTVSKFYEVQKYMTITEHVFTAAPFFINKSWLESLPEEYQQIIIEEAAQWTVDQRAAMDAGEETHLQTCKDAGMEIRELTPEEKQVWMDAASVLDDTIVEMYGEDIVNTARSYNK